MKRFLLTAWILFALVISSVNAQITVNRQDFPSIGYLVVNAVDEVTIIDPGQPGANQVWDFSNLVPTTVDSTYYLSPEGLPGYQDYPQANIATNHNPGSFPGGGYNVNFWNYSDQGLKAIADETLVNLFGTFYFAFHLSYTPPTNQVTFPFTYGSTNVQDFVMDWITAVRNDGVTTDSSLVRSYGNIDCLADAYGTMILPDGNFPVLRVRETWSSVDSSYIWESGTWKYDSDTVSNWTQYRWYANDFGEVGFYSENSAKANGFTFFRSETLVGVDDPVKQQEFTICPNPASSTVRIVCAKPIEKVEILDNSGRIVMQSGNKSTLNISGLNPGMYFIRIISGNEIGCRKLYKL
jgi:hypothetical protein